MKPSGILFLLILSLGLFLRVYQPLERFNYAHDSDLASWIVKDMLVDGHPRLVGQETSSQGIFIGPLYYYLLTPFYLATGLDPVGSIAFSWVIAAASLFSLYYVFLRLHSRRAAIIGSLIYAASFLLITTDRDVYPTTPVMLWTIWMFYAVNLLFRADKRGLLLSAVLLALAWHLNLALILVSPLVLLAVLIHRRHFALRDIILPIAAFIVLSLPLAMFEFRHDYLQTRSLFGSFQANQPIRRDYVSKLVHVVRYASRNANRIFYYDWEGYAVPAVLVVSFAFLVRTKRLPGYSLILYPLWAGLFLAFFTFHPINLSEYYLNGINVIWLSVAAASLSALPAPLIFAVLGLFSLFNFRLFFGQTLSRNGYLEKKTLAAHIAADAAAHNYPCVSVSYIVNPGYDLGYRYWFWLNRLHVNQPQSGSPVYTIVFPHSLVDRLDQTFGSLGLIYPEYSRYDFRQVKISCSGQNSNLTDPMFGFTK